MPRLCRILTVAAFAAALLAGVATFSGADATVLSESFGFSEPLWSPSHRGQDFEVPRIEGARTIGHAGEPMLPVFTARILLPPGEDVVSIRVVPEAAPAGGLHLPAPADAEHPLSMEGPFLPVEPQDEIYGSAALFPADAGELVTVQTYRGHRIAFINLFPLRVRPAIRQVEFTRALRLEVTTAPNTRALAESQRTYRFSHATRDWLQRNVVNPGMAERYRMAFEGGGLIRPEAPLRSLVDPSETRLYIIVTSEALAPVYALLAEDRTSKGLPAEVVTVDDIYANYTGCDQQEQIRNFIIDAYENWGVEYVLFGGDINVIPDRDCYCFIIDEGNPIETNNLCCELYYGGLDGTWNDDHDDRWGEVGEADLIPEVHVGRVCSDNGTEAQNFITKLLRYEREPVVDEVETAGFFGEYLWTDTWGGMYMEEIRLGSDAWGYTTVGVPIDWDTETYYEMTGNWSGQDYKDAANNGMHQIHHLGHSNYSYNMKVYTSEVPDFTADGIAHTYNIGYTQGCMAAGFDETDSILEEFVLSPTGYVAWMGNTRYGFGVTGTTNGSSQYYHRQFVDALFGEEINELAAANSDSRVDNIGYIEYEANRWVHYEITALGDPAMPIWTDEPRMPELDHAGVFMLGMEDYPITVRAGGAPVEGARVCMWDEEDSAYDFGVTDANGETTLQPQPTCPGIMHLVVSDSDLLVTEETMEIIAAGPYIVVASHMISDEAGGNNDGDCDAGETIDLFVELYNAWSGPVTGVTATLSGNSDYIEITDDTAEYGDFAGGEIKWGLDGDHFVFHIAGDCPDQEILFFEIEIRDDGQGIWTAGMSYPVDAPVLAIVCLVVDDSAGGDGNGCLDPGESAEITIRLANDGHREATSVVGTLISGDQRLTVTQPTAYAEEILAGDEVVLTPPFGVTLDAGAPSPDIITCMLNIAGDWELSLALQAGIGVGGFRDDMENGEGTWTHYVVTTGFNDQWHLSTQRNHTPDGAWSWKFGDTGSGDYANLSDGALVTAPIEIAETTVLTFWHWIDAEASATHPGRCYDGGLVELSLDGGEWEQITPEGGYPYTIRAGSIPGPFPEGTPVFSGSHDWTAETFMLASAGGSAQFRFRFGTDGADTREGWFIDDVEVCSWPPASTVDEPGDIVFSPVLSPNRPNPFAPETRIEFSLPGETEMRLAVHDLQGRLVRTLVSGRMPAGDHWIVWDGYDSSGRAVGSGIYFYRLESGLDKWVRKMTLLR